jgi:primosomal protein N'
MDYYCIDEKCNVFTAEKDLRFCPECKSKLVTHCPKCLKPLGGYEKGKSYGCKHCGHMFKTIRG